MLEVQKLPARSWSELALQRYTRSSLHAQILRIGPDWPRYERTLLIGLGILLFSIAARFVITTIQKHLAERAVCLRVECPAQARPGWRGEILEKPTIFHPHDDGMIQCYDPATGYRLSDIQADTPESIDEKIQLAKAAQVQWSKSSWSTRRKLMNTIQKWVVEDCETITRVAARDTGKTVSTIRARDLRSAHATTPVALTLLDPYRCTRRNRPSTRLSASC